MSIKIEVIYDQALEIGEAPHWDARTQALYFIACFECTMHKYTLDGVHTKTKLNGEPSFVIPVEGHLDQFVVGIDRDVVLVQWDGAEGSTARVLKIVASVDADAPVLTRLNDGKADPRGRLYSGTMAKGDVMKEESLQKKSSIYRVDRGRVTKVDDQISLSNGLAWDEAAGAMYFIDSKESKVRRYDYDVDTGNISNMTYLFDFTKHGIQGGPDGLTVDTDGNLWVAVFGSSCVHQISPQGKLLRRIKLPVEQVTSCTFGGPDLDILFVTSGFYDTGSGKLKPPNGYTYKISGLGVKGLPNVNYKL